MLRAFLLVGLGGAAGSMARYGVFLLMQSKLQNSFPAATFIVNMLGCLLIGLLFGLSVRQQWMQQDLMLALATGFCGGFTTFSAFALDNVGLMERQQSFLAIIYSVFSVVLGIALCRTGIWLLR